METRYTVRQASEMTGVKPYVMRYWEDELDLHIQRNELGHRYYTRYDIQLFLNIRELKKRGLQLRAIKDLIPQIARTAPGSSDSKIRLLEEAVSVNEVPVKEAVYSVEVGAAEETVNPKILEFQTILERLITQEIQSQMKMRRDIVLLILQSEDSSLPDAKPLPLQWIKIRKNPENT